MNRQLRICAIVTCGWFFVFLVLPFIQSVFHLVPEGNVTENRELAAFPKWGFRASYPHELQDYWNDHFGFRRPLGVAANQLAFTLGESPNSQIVLGKNGWLFYHENLITTKGPAAAQIATAAEHYLAYQEWLANRGIVYFLVLPLDKHNAYPEYLPDHLPKVESVDLYQRFRAYVQNNHSPLNLVDLSDITYAYKKRGQLLYFEDDNHWNDLGAMIGTTEMTAAFARVFPAIPKRQPSDYEWKQVPLTGGDLAAMIALPMLFPGTAFEVRPHFTPRAKSVDAGFTIPNYPPTRQPIATEIQDPSLPTAFFFRDSFMDRALKPISEDFRRSVYVWNFDNFLPDLVEREHPDLLVQESIERSLGKIVAPAPSIAAELADLKKRQQAFADCPAVFDRLSARAMPVSFRPRSPNAEERPRVPVLEVSGTAQVATVLAIDTGDGHPQKRVLYPRANKALVTLPGWPSEIRVEQRAGALAPDAALELTVKAIDPQTLADATKR